MAVPVNVMSLTRQPIKEKLSVSGPVSGTDSVDVVSNIHAEIITMNVKEGDKVTKDQILAVLDKHGSGAGSSGGPERLRSGGGE